MDFLQPIPPRDRSEREQKAQDLLVEEIQEWKRKKRAIVLCHNYQRPEVHRVADHVGDSYGLSVAAQKAECDLIVFCGVRFMAETAFLLNPTRKVLLPEEMAGCALADTITAEGLANLKSKYPGIPVVMYINCSAEVKALSDAICTSSNAVAVVDAMEGDTVLFGPDANLASFVKSRTKKKLIRWNGYCPVHKAVTREMLEKTIERFPSAHVIVHPECNPDVLELADEVLSTSQMIETIGKSPEKLFVVGTEIGLIQKAQELFPQKEIHPIYEHTSCDQSCACPYMKVTGLESVLRSLKTGTHEITVPEEIRLPAQRAIRRMLEIGVRR